MNLSKCRKLKSRWDLLIETEQELKERLERVKHKNDSSTKPFEILKVRYSFDTITKHLTNIPQWNHYKYYSTLQGAKDAIRDFREYDKSPRVFTTILENGLENEVESFTIINRYKIIERCIKLPIQTDLSNTNSLLPNTTMKQNIFRLKWLSECMKSLNLTRLKKKN